MTGDDHIHDWFVPDRPEMPVAICTRCRLAATWDEFDIALNTAIDVTLEAFEKVLRNDPSWFELDDLLEPDQLAAWKAFVQWSLRKDTSDVA